MEREEVVPFDGEVVVLLEGETSAASQHWGISFRLFISLITFSTSRF